MDVTQHTNLAKFLSEQFSAFPQVQAVALGGSIASGKGESGSDIDVYVFTTGDIPISERTKIVALRGASQASLDLRFWDPGDEWIDLPSGIEVDIIYWSPQWIEEMLDNVIRKHQASMGYSTCFWHTIKQAVPLFDREGWFTTVQTKTQTPFPEPLKKEIIEKNLAVLHQVIPSYFNQIKKALQRADSVSINHRIAAFFASYFDIIFAFNGVLHPGEKRLLDFAQMECAVLPVDMVEDVQNVLLSSGNMDPQLIPHLETLLNHLDQMLSGS